MTGEPVSGEPFRAAAGIIDQRTVCQLRSHRLDFTGQVTFLGAVGVMSFKGSVQDCTLNLPDMEVVKGQISADPACVLKLAPNGDLQGFYPTPPRGDQPVIIHPK
jgi:hypothetical protein